MILNLTYLNSVTAPNYIGLGFNHVQTVAFVESILPTGILQVAIASKQPGADVTVKQSGITMVPKQPGITIGGKGNM